MNSTKMYQDNMSAMKIVKNGQASLGKRSRHVNVRYFFVKDRLEYQTTSRLNTVTQKK